MSELLALADDDARQRWSSLQLGYTETQGLPALRAAIAAAHYTHTSADQLAVGAPQELLFLAMHALLRPGDRVVCTAPGYQSLHEVAASIGCDVSPWRLRCGPAGGHQ